MAEVVIVDSVMGAGKTTWAIQYMNEHPEESFLFVTPYKSECEERIPEELNYPIWTPTVKGKDHMKLDDIVELFQSGRDIASTHALFRMYDDRCRAAIKQFDYTLILDETMCAVEEYKLVHKDDIKNLKLHRDITVGADGMITWQGDTELDTSYNEIRNLAQNKCLFEVNNTCYIWQFPPDIFQLFKKIYILTYMFDGSIMKPYFDMHGISYVTKSIKKVGEKNVLVDYYKPDKAAFREKIHIYDKEDLNDDRKQKKKSMLSKTWMDSRSNAQAIKTIQAHIYNYFRNKMQAKSEDIMWTTWKDKKHKLKGKGYTNGFVSCNCRSTNNYRSRHYLAYAVNMYVHPMVEHYFNQHGFSVDADKYALSEMIQWIWRSAIRDGEDIYIYIPSKRMRDLLQLWLND